jgi:hypothetical protein
MLEHLGNNIEESKMDTGRTEVLKADVSATGIPARSVYTVYIGPPFETRLAEAETKR